MNDTTTAVCSTYAGLRAVASRTFTLLALVCFAASSTASADSGSAVARDAIFSAEQVFAVGDVHGAYERLVALLRANDLIDETNHWSGGAAHLVSLGDLLDRGPRSRDVMDLFRRLQGEAAIAGGRVHVLLGNHEVMNLTGDLRDVSDAEYAAFAALSSDASDVTPPGYAEHREAFAEGGEYGRWLLGLPLIIQVNDTVFTHGGLSPLLDSRTITQLNSAASRELVTAVRRQDVGSAPQSLLGGDGPLWYRGSAACHPLLEAPVVQKQLAGMSARRLVIGHTPTPTRKIRQRLQGRVIAIDTGMLESVYRGMPYLLSIKAADVTVLDVNAQATVPQWWHPLLTVEPSAEARVGDALNRGGEVPGQWISGGKKDVLRALARLATRSRATTLDGPRWQWLTHPGKNTSR